MSTFKFSVAEHEFVAFIMEILSTWNKGNGIRTSANFFSHTQTSIRCFIHRSILLRLPVLWVPCTWISFSLIGTLKSQIWFFILRYRCATSKKNVLWQFNQGAGLGNIFTKFIFNIEVYKLHMIVPIMFSGCTLTSSKRSHTITMGFL